MAKAITVETTVHVPLDKAWEVWTSPKHITQWNFASDDWECPHATNNPVTGGKFSARMQAKDGSAGFDFEGTYSHVKKHEILEYAMPDGRRVSVHFHHSGKGTKVIETFEMESENSEELQRSGWQAILDNFKEHAEKVK